MLENKAQKCNLRFIGLKPDGVKSFRSETLAVCSATWLRSFEEVESCFNVSESSVLAFRGKCAWLRN